MEQFNKALSFILGLVVVAVFIVVASGKFKFPGINLPKSKISGVVTPTVTPKPTSKPWFFGFGNNPTPTPKPTSKPVIPLSKITLTKSTLQVKNQPNQPQNQTDPNYHTYSGSNVPTSIPNTGVPIVLFPLFGSSLLGGIFMRRTGKKE